MFPGHLILLQEDLAWFPWSLDLSPYDFLYEYFKTTVFKHRLQTFEELKEAIREQIAETLHDVQTKVVENFWERLHMRVARQCYHLDNIIFKW